MNNALPSGNEITKDEFAAMVARIEAALATHDDVYPAMIANAMAFDRQLAAKIQAAADADAALLTYIKSKAEQRTPGLLATIGSLLLAR